MKDEFRRNWFKVMGWMYTPKCSCCNCTIAGNYKKNHKARKRVVNKQVRTKLKEQLRKGY